MEYRNIYVTSNFFLNKWIHLVSSQVNITVSPTFLSAPHLCIQPASKYSPQIQKVPKSKT